MRTTTLHKAIIAALLAIITIVNKVLFDNVIDASEGIELLSMFVEQGLLVYGVYKVRNQPLPARPIILPGKEANANDSV